MGGGDPGPMGPPGGMMGMGPMGGMGGGLGGMGGGPPGMGGGDRGFGGGGGGGRGGSGMGGMGGRGGGPPGAPPGGGMEPLEFRELFHKTRLCNKFMNTGECSYGPKCHFAHGPQELRPMPDLVSIGHKREQIQKISALLVFLPT